MQRRAGTLSTGNLQRLGLAGPRAEQLGPHSYGLVALAFAAGLAGTFAWWHRADHTRQAV